MYRPNVSRRSLRTRIFSSSGLLDQSRCSLSRDSSAVIASALMGTTPRRTFLKVAGIGGASILTDMTTSGETQAQEPARASVKSIETSVLSIAYEDSGDARGFPIILLHGFPD